MKKHLSKKLVSGVMAAIMLSSTVAPLTLAAEESVIYDAAESFSAVAVPRAGYTALNFSYAGATAECTVGVSSLISKSTGESVSAAEAAYLDSLGISMRYDAGLVPSLISASTSKDTLTFTAKASSYQAYNGATIRWVPATVTVDGKTESFSVAQGSYTASFSGLEKDKAYTATFTYRTSIKVSASALTAVVNRAYDDAQTAIKALADYEQAKIDYENAHVRYENALKEYETLYEAYRKYQQELKDYQTELAAYNAYKKLVDAYKEQMAFYNDYLKAVETFDERYAAYEKELAELPAKQEQYEKYLEYLALVKKAEKQLDAINSVFVADSVGRTMYATLMGDTVAQVLAQRDLLIDAAGVSENDINNAGDSTTVLQRLLSEYRKQSGVEAKLEWYSKNYNELNRNFGTLYASLRTLGNNIVVRRELKKRERWERYVQFVGQLHIISAGLNDNETIDYGWTYHDFLLTNLVESSQYITDDNSYAPSSEFPEKMEPVEKPVVPTAPQKPAEVKEPVKGWTVDVEHPGVMPTAVQEPKKPSLSDFVSGAPQMPEISTQLETVVAAVRAGTLTERRGALSDVTLDFDTNFSQSASISSAPLVTFFGHDGKTVLYSAQVEKGGTAVYGGTTPTRDADMGYSYVFSGWVDANGNPASLSNIQKNTSFYANFTQKANAYTITWVVAGRYVKESYLYGSLPNYKGELSYRDDTYQYIFTGWSPSISKVSGDAIYTAQYTTRKLESQSFSVTFTVRGETYYKTYSYGTMPDLSEYEKDYVADGYRYVFKGWSPTLSEVTQDAAYEAIFEKTFLIPAGEDGKESAEMSVTKTSHIVTTKETVVNAAYAVEEALKAGTQLVLNLGGASITLDNEILRNIPNAAYFRLEPKNGADGETLVWLLSITDAKGNELALPSEILIELPLAEGKANDGRLNGYINGKATALTVQENTAYLRLQETGEIVLRPYYKIHVISEGSGNLTVGADTAEVGATVSPEPHFAKGWTLKTLAISVNGGAETLLSASDTSFVMPSGDVTLRAVFAEAEYTVVFMVRGKELSRKIYHYGEEVEIPDMNSYLNYTENEKTYTFSGWDYSVTPVVGDVIYTACYQEGIVGDKDIDTDNSGFPLYVGLLLAGLGGIGGISVATWSIVKKKRRKK